MVGLQRFERGRVNERWITAKVLLDHGDLSNSLGKEEAVEPSQSFAMHHQTLILELHNQGVCCQLHASNLGPRNSASCAI